jgi:pimeloyl-ACP methyl ester carboxylesterase
VSTASPAVVALHGFGDSGSCWRPWLRRAGLDGSASTPNLIAHGGRALPVGSPFTHEALVRDVVPAVETVVATRGPVLLAGHSLGASTAVGVAATRPDLVAGLLLEDPPWSAPSSPAEDAAEEERNDFGDWLAGLAGTDHEGRLGWVRARHPHWAPDEASAWAESKAQVDLALFDAPQHWLRRTWWPVARSVRCPVTLLRGSVSRGGACASEVAATLGGLAGWQVVTVHAAGHDVRRDAPAATAAAVRALLERSRGR